MNDFVLEPILGRVLFAVGARHRLVEEVERLEPTRVVVFADPWARPMIDELTAALGDRFGAWFDDVVQHVPQDRARAALEVAGDADLLVAVGGGSSIGYAKVVAVESGAPIVAVPTTYAGSERTPILGITDASGKHTSRNPRALPTTVIYDPELTLTMPGNLSVTSGLNALAHAVEGAWSTEANPITTLLAGEAVRRLVASLPAVVATPGDLGARSEALYGAFLGGTVLGNSGMAVHHRICHVLGGRYGLPHAETHSVILPHAVALNAPGAPGTIALLREALGVDDAAAGLWDLSEGMGAPTRLADLGMDAADLDDAATASAEPPPSNPVPVTTEGVRRLLQDAWEGRRPSEAPAA